ncbi:MAG: hypothetical protein LQ337_006934 [Flavoplaca oasis]|nr:MAG: hypothetical protein LQ337_006934 [Flavoplaca oasis]
MAKMMASPNSDYIRAEAISTYDTRAFLLVEKPGVRKITTKGYSEYHRHTHNDSRPKSGMENESMLPVLAQTE